MARSRLISFALSVVILASACGGSPSASNAPGASPASSGTAAGHLPKGFEVPAISVATLAERDERVWADGLRESGAADLLGPKLSAWLDEQRHAFVDGVLTKGGIQAGGNGRIASTDPSFGLETQTALGGGGLTLALTGAFVRAFSESAMPNADGEPEFSLHDTDTHDTEVDGHRATVQMQIGMDFHYAGERLAGTVTLTMTTTIFDAKGKAIGTITVESTSTVDMEICPDIDGGLNAHFDTRNVVTSTGAGAASAGSYNLTTSGVATGQVGDDANLHSLHVTGESDERSTGTGARAVDAAVRLDFTSSLGTAGDMDTMTFDEENFHEDVTRADDATTSDDLTKLDIEIVATGIVVASLLFEAAQAKWRSGYCVRIEATESSRDVEPDEEVPFSAKVFHNFDGVELDKPIVATLNGVKSATPLEVAQDPPANIRYTAGSNEGDRGVVTLKSTSNRGIGTLDLSFTVQPELVMQFEMESEITATKLAGLPGGGVALAYGEILLEKDATGHWSGQGDLTSKTTPAPLACNSVSVAGRGSYNWWIRDVVARPEGTTVDLSMDAQLPQENPDIGTTKFCPGPTTTSKVDTWENLFFISHNKDYGSLGLHVTDWTIVATPDTWKTGGLVAEAEWHEDCNGPRSAGPPVIVMPSGAPDLPPGLLGSINECTGNTYMRLRLVPPPVP